MLTLPTTCPSQIAHGADDVATAGWRFVIVHWAQSNSSNPEKVGARKAAGTVNIVGHRADGGLDFARPFQIQSERSLVTVTLNWTGLSSVDFSRDSIRRTAADRTPMSSRST